MFHSNAERLAIEDESVFIRGREKGRDQRVGQRPRSHCRKPLSKGQMRVCITGKGAKPSVGHQSKKGRSDDKKGKQEPKRGWFGVGSGGRKTFTYRRKDKEFSARDEASAETRW